MSLLKTTRLTKQGDRFEIEIPPECVEKLGWRKGLVLEIDIQDSKAIIKKLQGFVGT
ncbi:hypothetical protein AAA799B03_00948 [Marine Group I thaumarchaeote SCGC AAA799-B03]|uniref:AbrB family transcriptional regulator protein n=4 Tax=Marine Group I TaxID=905826 RepID=A0A087S714_9ARCH|nr:hypothetical protein AAA799N04_00745 [Marine Group I thaumarchaeote SCGC AAA799-N04]KFM15525.1 hypothetical protein AAA799D11_01248 [Marine Group I thaumarchaeote SCGC AAA799-D11]KFM19252.1 hypothetical protein SCCGRSA3_00842 [Marine Group I thaumarchaeote SCGC RSA3]KFM21518.1 hypothetical protein AAA799B03_00948 [Marine Group I thaumarchaeote SCGC AAA799-B03]